MGRETPVVGRGTALVDHGTPLVGRETLLVDHETPLVEDHEKRPVAEQSKQLEVVHIQEMSK